MSRRCTIVRNDVLDRLLAIERQARVVVECPYLCDSEHGLDELARLLGPRKE